jgi:hypothetical protein
MIGPALIRECSDLALHPMRFAKHGGGSQTASPLTKLLCTMCL